MEITITATEHVSGVSLSGIPYDQICYVYQLIYQGRAWYVGTSVNPTSRLLSHISLTTKNTCKRIAEMQAAGRPLTMKLVDVTVRAHRYQLEGRWIHHTPDALNSQRYYEPFREWAKCPTCFRAASTDTLSGPKPPPPPKKKISRKRADNVFALKDLIGIEAARKHDPEAAEYFWGKS